MISPDEIGSDAVDDGEEAEAQPTLRPSRSQKHRDAAAVNELGLELIALIPSDLDLLDLPSELRHEIDVCQGLKMRAQSRQKRLIGQLLRAEDHEGIRERVDKLRMLRVTGSGRDREARGWVARLIEEGDPALQAFVDAHPEADRSRMRTLMRTAGGDPEATKVKRARRELQRAIRSLLS